MIPNRSATLDPHDRRILLNTCYGHFMSHFNMLVFPALVLPLMAHLDMQMAQVLSLSFWMYLLFGLTALVWGLLADRFGARVLLFLFLLGMQPIENTLVARFAPKRFHHSAFGAKFVLTFGVGALAVKGVAVIETGYGIETIFIYLAFVAAVALGFIGWLIVGRSKRDAAGGGISADVQLPSAKA